MWRDASTSQRASQLSAAIFQAPFLVSLVVINKVLALTHPLSKSLQKIDIDYVNNYGFDFNNYLFTESKKILA